MQIASRQKYLLNNIHKIIAFLTINVDAVSTDDVFWETLRILYISCKLFQRGSCS